MHRTALIQRSGINITIIMRNDEVGVSHTRRCGTRRTLTVIFILVILLTGRGPTPPEEDR